MNLQEATEYTKAFLNQEIDANTLRKACASGRLTAVRKGEGEMHVRRTEWDVGEEELIQFVREKYHPRPNRRQLTNNVIHIPKQMTSIDQQNNSDNNKLKEKTSGRVSYRVLEHLYQRPLPIHGETLEKYDTRVVEEKITSKVKAEALVTMLETKAQAANLASQLRYQVEDYTDSKKIK